MYQSFEPPPPPPPPWDRRGQAGMFTQFSPYIMAPGCGDLSGGLAGHSPTFSRHIGNLFWDRDLT